MCWPAQVICLLRDQQRLSTIFGKYTKGMKLHHLPLTAAAFRKHSKTLQSWQPHYVRVFTSLEVDAINKRMVDREYLNHRQSRIPYKNKSPSRFRSSSRHRSSAMNNPNWLCKYHYRFGSHARKCEKPCKFQQETRTNTTIWKNPLWRRRTMDFSMSIHVISSSAIKLNIKPFQLIAERKFLYFRRIGLFTRKSRLILF